MYKRQELVGGIDKLKDMTGDIIKNRHVYKLVNPNLNVRGSRIYGYKVIVDGILKGTLDLSDYIATEVR